MATIFSIPGDRSGQQILCGYVNDTSVLQVVRIGNIPNWYYERIVFPGQRLFFEAPPHALLEVYTGTIATAMLSDKLRCDRLRVQEPTPTETLVARG